MEPSTVMVKNGVLANARKFGFAYVVFGVKFDTPAGTD